MGQSYRLRLGDGTILMVDRAGLGNWLSDRRALVQPAGQDLWTPLRSFLVQERSAARRAARDRSQPPSTSRDALPLVYPKPLEKPASGPRIAEVPAQQQVGVPGEAREPEPTVRAGGLSLVPPPPPQASRPQAPPPPIPSERPDEGLVLPPFLAEPEPAPAPPIEPAEPTRRVPPAPVETPTERAALPAERTASRALAEAFSADSPSPAEEDVGWMTLPPPHGDEPPGPPAASWPDRVATSSVGASPSRPEEAPGAMRSPARRALGPFLGRWIEILARQPWRAARLWLGSHAASAYGALLALWRSPGRDEHPSPSSSPGEPAPRPAGGPERSAPLPPRPSTGAPPAGRVLAEKRRDSPAVYRPRRSPHDGLPLLQLEPLDDEEGWASAGGTSAQSSADDPSEIVLEPIDE